MKANNAFMRVGYMFEFIFYTLTNKWTWIFTAYLVALLWCRPLWWDDIGIHYYEKVFCKCTQCQIVDISELYWRGSDIDWRFE